MSLNRVIRYFKDHDYWLIGVFIPYLMLTLWGIESTKLQVIVLLVNMLFFIGVSALIKWSTNWKRQSHKVNNSRKLKAIFYISITIFILVKLALGLDTIISDQSRPIAFLDQLKQAIENPRVFSIVSPYSAVVVYHVATAFGYTDQPDFT